MSLKITIVTTSYNSESTIEDTIKSVLSQKYQNFEHIIVDGASKDNTMEIVKKYEKKYKGKLKYISEKDKGIYDAMNKGIKMATGDVIGLLNSDDVYKDEYTLEKIANAITKEYDGCYGNLLYVNETLTVPKRKWVSGVGKVKNGWLPAHPTLYLRKEVYEKYGNYNMKYKVVSDYDFMIRVCTKKNVKLNYIKDNLILMRIGGASSSGLKGYIYNMKESTQILKDNGYKFAWIITLKRICITLWQYIGALFVRR